MIIFKKIASNKGELDYSTSIIICLWLGECAIWLKYIENDSYYKPCHL